MVLEDLAGLDYCYLSTTGRVSGQLREIEIWFGVSGGTVYMLAGGGEHAHWVRNIRQRPDVSVRIGDRRLQGKGRVVDAPSEEDALARRLLLGKYSPGYDGDLADWGKTALAVAVDLALVE